MDKNEDSEVLAQLISHLDRLQQENFQLRKELIELSEKQDVFQEYASRQENVKERLYRTSYGTSLVAVALGGAALAVSATELIKVEFWDSMITKLFDGSSGSLIFAMIGTAIGVIVSLIMYRNQRRIYTTEIERIAGARAELLHHIEAELLHSIEEEGKPSSRISSDAPDENKKLVPK